MEILGGWGPEVDGDPELVRVWKFEVGGWLVMCMTPRPIGKVASDSTEDSVSTSSAL